MLGTTQPSGKGKRKNPFEEEASSKGKNVPIRTPKNAVYARTRLLLFHGQKRLARKDATTEHIVEAPCSHCKKRNEVTKCNFCEQKICEECSGLCKKCEMEFCSLCSVKEYDVEGDFVVCLSCND
ncbi:Apoptosis regulatory protein Siva [Basidiobolus ranarum]|uniref:Apoptosis regulatory protein Siva n=1 Tax=Basidiobolus ranarum TaxID=34480 RepID=A0ABR2WB04_9FUNG